MTKMEFIQLILLINCLVISLLSFVISIVNYIRFQARENSTHTIEFRDPEEVYPDELILQKNENGKIERKEFINEDDLDVDEQINKLNRDIEEDKVIL